MATHVNSIEPGKFPESILAWKNPMDRGAWQATMYRVTKSPIRLTMQHILNNILKISLHCAYNI